MLTKPRKQDSGAFFSQEEQKYVAFWKIIKYVYVVLLVGFFFPVKLCWVFSMWVKGLNQQNYLHRRAESWSKGGKKKLCHRQAGQLVWGHTSQWCWWELRSEFLCPALMRRITLPEMYMMVQNAAVNGILFHISLLVNELIIDHKLHLSCGGNAKVNSFLSVMF